MNRYQKYGQRDTPWIADGDPYFKGIDMRDRGMLAPGYLARCENKRLRDGVAATRPGTSFPGDFNPQFENKIIGSHIYSAPNGEEVMLIATAGADYVWVLQFNKDPIQIEIDASDPTQDTGDGFVHFVQAFEKVLMLRFPFAAQPPLVWDGDSVTPTTFVPVTATSPPSPFVVIPATITGVPFQNRVILYNPYDPAVPWRDQFIMSQTLDYTIYDPTLLGGTFRVNAGESDMITSVFPYFKGGVVVFMRDSTHLVQDFTVDASLTTQRLLNSKIGGVGIYAPAMVGADVVFLSKPGGFYRLSQIDQENIAAEPTPISRGIQPIIDSIAWDRANIWTCSATLGDYLYFALPVGAGISLDGSTIVVVLNTATGEWESAPDSWNDPDFHINRLHVTLYDSAKRVFGIDYVAQRVYLMYDGLEDELNGSSIPVQDVIETRGYVCGDPGGFKSFQRTVIGIKSLDPSATVTALSDGVNEEKELATITKDKLKFYVHGKADFAPITGDPTEPYREDYADAATNAAIEDFEDLPDGELLALPPTSLIFSANKQQSLERFQVRQNGRWCSIRIENTNGQLDVLGVGIEAIPTQEGIKVLA